MFVQRLVLKLLGKHLKWPPTVHFLNQTYKMLLPVLKNEASRISDIRKTSFLILNVVSTFKDFKIV